MSGGDTLDFVERALAIRGALCERTASTLDAVLPPAAAASLALPEAVRLSADGREGTVAAGPGSVLLERLLAEEMAEARVAGAVLGDPGHAVAPTLGAAFTLLNGVLDPSQALDRGREQALLFAFAWKAECDDLREGMALTALSASSGASVDGYAALLADETFSPGGARPPDAAPLARSARLAAHRARTRVLGELAEHVAAVGRRKGRDVAQVRSYFASLKQEAARRRQPDEGKMAVLKLARIAEEEAAKLEEIEERYRLRVELRPAALVVLDVAVRRAAVTLRRRKKERRVTLVHHPALRAWEPVVCEGCGGEGFRFAACDDELHLLCTACHGSDTRAGRRPCPRCARGTEWVPDETSIAPAGTVAPAAPEPEPEPTRAGADAAAAVTGSTPAGGQLLLAFAADEIVAARLPPSPGVTARDLAMAAELPTETVRAALRRLVEAGRAIRSGRGPGVRYAHPASDR